MKVGLIPCHIDAFLREVGVATLPGRPSGAMNFISQKTRNLLRMVVRGSS